ncbi:NACHT domain-containing protein [Kribbella pittospori]|uniref:NACHT domain-containing protein n=1 Tax=Kribbella pittospori TaxID=722689 RepID=A0A4R0L470_9ACTN|nr:NACHT domain-containing protein [Kribbella pittospori]TCC65688.1 NACHT domain-containing protein [Kribbella pittospori]
MWESLLAELISAGLIRIAKQLGSGRRAAATGRERTSGTLLLEPLDLRTAPLRGTVDMPDGMTHDDLQRFLQRPDIQCLAFELTTLGLTSTQASAYESVSRRWDSVFSHHFSSIDQASSRPLFEMLVRQRDAAIDALKRTKPDAYELLRSEASSNRSVHVLEAIERRLAEKAGQVDPIALDRFVARYRKQAAIGHGFIEPPDFEHRRKVPIDRIYVTPTIVDSDSQSAVSLEQEIDRTVLLGDPGHGKSTASQVVMWQFARDPGSPVPFLVILREFAAPHAPQKSVIEHIADKLRAHYHCEPPSAKYIEHLFETGAAMVIFDGLDELLDTSRRRDVTDAVGHFCNTYPLARSLVTSRRVGYAQAPMDSDQFRVLQLTGFNEDQVAEYVEKWFAQEDGRSRAAEWAASFLSESSAVPDLRETPLLLALMCIIYRGERSIPKNRPAVYEKCATMLYEQWDGHRKLAIELRAGQMVDPSMKHLAFWLLTSKGDDGATESELVDETTNFLLHSSFEDSGEAEAAALEFVRFCRGRAWVFSDVGSTSDGEPLYKFTHRTFLEYFSAHHLSRVTDTPEELADLLDPHLAVAEWDVVAQLAVQIVDKKTANGAARIFNRLMTKIRGRAVSEQNNILAFLGRCLSFVQLAPPVIRELIHLVVVHTALREYPVGHEAAALNVTLSNVDERDVDTVKVAIAQEISDGVSASDEDLWRYAEFLLCAGTSLGNISTPGRRDDWIQYFDDLADTHADTITRAASESLDIQKLALLNHRADIRSVLERNLDGTQIDLNWMFEQVEPKLFSFIYIEPAFVCLSTALTPGEHNVWHREWLGPLGEFLQGYEVAPIRMTFGRGSRSYLFESHSGTESLSDPTASEILAVGYLLAVTYERSGEDANTSGRPEEQSLVDELIALRMGQFSSLRPLLMKRFRPEASDSDPISEFPMLERWSDGEVDFTARV